MTARMSLKAMTTWFRLNRRTFSVTIAVTGLVVVALALVLGLDDVMRTGFGALVLALTLPFALTLAIIVFFVVLFLPLILLGALLGDADIAPDPGFGGDSAGDLVGGYYGWVGKQRNPVFWGIPAGIGIGVAALATIAYIRDAPLRTEERERERLAAETQQIMARTRELLEAHYDGEQAYPDRIEPVADSYGRPLRYVVVESRTRSSFTLTSQGPTAGDPRDDVCVQGYRRHDDAKLVGKIIRRAVFGTEPEPVRCPKR
jgi:hypothetical protein